MKIRFLADENLRRAILIGVRRREPAISFLQASDVGAAGKDDLTILQVAADAGRVLVSHDVRTMPKHFHEFTTTRESPGVFLVPQPLALSRAIDELVLLWFASDAEDWINQLRYLAL